MGKTKAVSLITSLNFGCYPGYCLFATGHNFSEIRESLQSDSECDAGWVTAMEHDEFADECSAIALHRSAYNKDSHLRHYYYVLFRQPFGFSDQNFIVLAHELIHICQFYIPAVFDRNKEHEAEAYLHSHLMCQALKALRG